jgi:acetaldehyde dehydrogenase
MTKTKVAIVGSGNIGTDLMFKIMRLSTDLEVSAMVGIDAASDGIARARRLGVPTTTDGVDGFMTMPAFDSTEIIFDATSAKAHCANAEKLKRFDKLLIDLTPAAIGPFVVPAVNLDEHLDAGVRNLNMVTCGGQATVPIVAAVGQSGIVSYAEIVSSISAKSAGPGTRANIDEFTETTSTALQVVGGAQRGKAVMIINPADPPVMMRNTVYCLVDGDADHHVIENDVLATVEKVNSYVPGYRLKQRVQFETFSSDRPLYIPETGKFTGTRVTVLLEVTGAAHYLPAYAGNLDIMTSAAKATAERIAAYSTEAAGAPS